MVFPDKLPRQVKIVEVGPRDGLQNESRAVPSEDKVRLITALAASGLKHIEITSFVSPKWIPQLADSSAVASLLQLPADVDCSALVPNEKGLEAARQAGLKHIAVFMSATESHSKKNINKSVEEALITLSGVTASAKAGGMRVRGYMSVVFACPYEGKTDVRPVVDVVKRFLDTGIDELSLGDTIGAATPLDVVRLLRALDGIVDKSKIALHFHDTRGTALANVVAGLAEGIAIYDASIGGMGGCPYAPGASGNLATEDLVYMLEGMGIATGVDLENLVEAGKIAQEVIQRQLPGRYLQACLATQTKACKNEQTRKAEPVQ